MRAFAAVLFLVHPACSFVIDGRTKPFEGACADEEEGVRALYDPETHEASTDADAIGVETIAQDCHGCATQDCVERCIRDDTKDAITTECAACFADHADCTEANCSAECARLDDPACHPCLCAAGCGHDFDECTGLEIANCG